MMLEDLVRGDSDAIGWDLSEAPVIPKEELKKEPTRQEITAELAKEEKAKGEVCSVVTRGWGDTLSGIGDTFGVNAGNISQVRRSRRR